MVWGRFMSRDGGGGVGPLASVDDLEDRGLELEDGENTVVEAFLRSASGAVREAAGVPISQATSTVVLEGDQARRIRLPGPPVTDVDEVLLGGAPTDYRLLRASGALWRQGGWQTGTGPSEVEVTYTHGLEHIPDDIVDLVCRMAATALVAYRSSLEEGEHLVVDRISQERLGDWSAMFSNDQTLSSMELPATTRDRLRARFGGGATVVRMVA